MGACASSEAPVADIPPAKPHQPRPHEQTGGHPLQQEPARVDAAPAKTGVDAGPPEAAELLNGLAGGDPQPLGSGAVDNAIAVLKAMDPLACLSDLLADMNTLSPTPALALPEVADLIRSRLEGIELCSITAIVGPQADGQGDDDDIRPPQAAGVLMAVAGGGCKVLEGLTVVRGPQWSALHVAVTNAPLHVHSAEAGELPDGSPLPEDLARLCSAAGLASFLAVPMALGPQVLGVLTVGAAQPDAFADPGWQRLMAATASACVQHMRSPQLCYLASMLACAEGEEDDLGCMEVLIYGLSMYMRRCTNLKVSVRVGLVDRGRKAVLVLEGDPKAPKVKVPPPTSMDDNSFRPPPRVARALVATDVPLGGTLLESAVTAHKARCIKDCAAYFQSAVDPVGDIFTAGSSLVSSMAVVPFSHNESDLGGITGWGAIYFTLPEPCDFALLQEDVLGAVSATTLTLHARLRDRAAALGPCVAEVTDQRRRSSSIAEGAPGAEVEAASVPGSAGLSKGAPFSANNKKLCTEAMKRAIQHKLQTTHKGGRRSTGSSVAAPTNQDLVLHDRIGQGGFGICYKGMYKNSVAAIKVMYARKHEKEALKDAVEMAVLSEVNHPHIVQLYACLTDMIEVAADKLDVGVAQLGGTAQMLPHYRPARPDDAVTCNIVIMEFCDRGSLRDALKRGAFHRRLEGGVMAVDVLKVVRVLLQVSSSLEYLHDRKILHCDIKMENVMLKSDPSREMGFVAKLGDFGLAKMLNDNYFVTNRSGAGTITHLAPELLKAGAKLTEAIDTYAFGILMYTMYAAQRPYASLTQEQIVDRVIRKGMRPTFPSAAPAAFVNLASRCWDADPKMRPSFVEISATLKEIINGEDGGGS